jgi:hypothetical protein
MKYSFHPAAEEELDIAIAYYEECKTGLGYEFAHEVFSTIHRIINFPQAWTRLSENSRRCITNRFPYGVIYQIKHGTINVVAIMRLNQKPFYWQDRIK